MWNHLPTAARFAVTASLFLANPGNASEACTSCHVGHSEALGSYHQFSWKACTSCHRGNGRSPDEKAAHDGLVASPGQLDNAAATCGLCHPRQIDGVLNGDMHRGTGMVATTRKVIDGVSESPPAPHDLQHLGASIADSLLRKLCAGCHLGQPRHEGMQDAALRRGGGCLACHIKPNQASGHPVLSAKVEDGSCFGCHSRSGRIALNYAGLAEVETPELSANLYRLSDGRLVIQRPADSHHRAGMSCIDCHTGGGLMGLTADNIDIACTDCHANLNARISLEDWPQNYVNLKRRIPFAAGPGQSFLTTRQGTPLWHIEIRGDDLFLHRKLDGATMKIPRLTGTHAPFGADHERLSCDACHSQWAPQCYGCHISFDPEEEQWDHVLRKPTRGAWEERRWDLRSGMAPLGIHTDGTVRVFVPGMVMTLEHPDRSTPLFVRRFAMLSPHTTGPSHACDDCHANPVAFGLGDGKIHLEGEELHFIPTHELLNDGLPADAWTDLSRTDDEQGEESGPFPASLIERLLSVPVIHAGDK